MTESIDPEATTDAPDDDSPAEPVDDLGAVEDEFGYRFERRRLLRMALTHRSYSNEQGEEENYERLEFLGDAVLGLVTSHWLYERYPDRPEGDLARLKGFLVSAPALSRLAEGIELGARLRLGVGERRSGGQTKASILADTMEAIFGAIYLDGGLEAAHRVIVLVLERTLEERSRYVHVDAKTVLQEQAQARGWGLPIYRLTGESGPDHRKVFAIECMVDGQIAGQADGRSKKLAEQRAAAAALEALDLVEGTESWQ